jgi:hypothetical protein
MIAPRSMDARKLGSEQIFIGSIAEPERSTGPVGVVVIGLGIADIQAVRRFAGLGFVAMQIRLIKDPGHHGDFHRRHATYDASGVARCTHAMDLLAEAYGIQQFILMGNCALANICFNTAIAERRVIGLILTNPHVSDTFTASVSFKIRRHLFRWRSWLRLLMRDMRIPWTAALTSARLRSAGGESQPARWNFKKDIALPPDFDRKLEGLLRERPVRALIVFSRNEVSLDYFQRFYHRTIERLVAAGTLRFEIIPIDTHDFSARDDSALRLNELITDWARARQW